MATHRSQEGAATVEAVVFLPVLILLFFAVTYASRLYSTALHAEEVARLCVNLYAKQGCSDGLPLPAACGGKRPATSKEPKKSEGDDALDAARDNEDVEDVENRLGMLSDVLDAIFGPGRRASVTEETPGAANVNLPGRRVRAVNYALCNTQPVPADSMAHTLYKAFRDNPPKRDSDD